MARQTLVVDASVGIKWFSAVGEAHVAEARALLLEYARGSLNLVVPELFYHEISNALVHKESLSIEQLLAAMTTLCALNMTTFPANAEHLQTAAQLARKVDITEYEACYAVAAIQNGCPLITANPRHQSKEFDCEVIPIEQWR